MSTPTYHKFFSVDRYSSTRLKKTGFPRITTTRPVISGKTHDHSLTPQTSPTGRGWGRDFMFYRIRSASTGSAVGSQAQRSVTRSKNKPPPPGRLGEGFYVLPHPVCFDRLSGRRSGSADERLPAVFRVSFLLFLLMNIRDNDLQDPQDDHAGSDGSQHTAGLDRDNGCKQAGD